MTVYVDDMYAPYGRFKMCHMIADNTEELLQMAQRIGVDVKWIQYAGTYREHFDICMSKRSAAVMAGAVEITMKDLCKKTIARKSMLTVTGNADKVTSSINK